MKLVLAGLLLLTACTAAPVQPQPDTPLDTPVSTTPTPADRVSMENFGKIQSGMTLAQVEAILGKGNLVSEMETAGVGKFSTYSWQSQSTANITARFMEGRMNTKMQFGLK